MYTYRIDEEILPNPKLFDDYIDLNPVHRSVQVSGEFSEHEVSRCRMTRKRKKIELKHVIGRTMYALAS